MAGSSAPIDISGSMEMSTSGSPVLTTRADQPTGHVVDLRAAGVIHVAKVKHDGRSGDEKNALAVPHALGIGPAMPNKPKPFSNLRDALSSARRFSSRTVYPATVQHWNDVL
jgi:hypothetical protein